MNPYSPNPQINITNTTNYAMNHYQSCYVLLSQFSILLGVRFLSSDCCSKLSVILLAVQNRDKCNELYQVSVLVKMLLIEFLDYKSRLISTSLSQMVCSIHLSTLALKRGYCRWFQILLHCKVPLSLEVLPSPVD